MTRLDRQHGQEPPAANPTDSADSLAHLGPSSSSTMAGGGDGEADSLAVDSQDGGIRSRSTAAGSLADANNNPSARSGLAEAEPGPGPGVTALSMRGQLTRGESERTITIGNHAN